nr:polyprotein [Bat picornavirus BtSY4]
MEPTTLWCPCFQLFFIVDVYGDNMAVKSVVAGLVSVEKFISKYSNMLVEVFVLTKRGFARIVRSRVVHTRSVSKNRVYNCGVGASRAQAGNNHQVHGGRDVVQINYYGSNYAQAAAKGEGSMDPERFTKPIQALGGVPDFGPALKSPNVEELGLSDRIGQLTAGNSAITTQEAAAAVVGYGEWPEYDSGVGEAIDRPTQPGPSVERFYTLDSVNWTSSSKGWIYRLPGAINDQGVFGQNCAYHFLCRTGYCVHVQLNASKFHQGMVLVAMVPEYRAVDVNNPGTAIEEMTEQHHLQVPINQLTLFPHQLVNVRTNNSATIIMPYTNCNPAESALTHNTVSLVIVPIVSLSYNTGATTYVPITVSVAPMCSQFSGLRNSVPRPPTFQGVPVFEIPGSGQFMTTLKNSGFPALPDFEETPPHHIPGKVTNLLEVAQVDTFCDASGNTDTTIAYTFDVSAQTSSGGKIREWDMSMNSKLFAPTYLGRLSKFFTHYRGSLNLTFMFCGSAMATGKFLIAYTPPGGNPPQARSEAMLGTHIIWDVGLQSSVVFTIPYVSQSQYRYNNQVGNVLSYDGWITVFYQTNIVVPPGAPSTCSVVVMMSAARDFVLRLATDNAFYQGIGDDLGKVIQDNVKTVTQNVLAIPASNNAQEVPSTLSIQTGDTPALTAPETGASASVEAGQLMETRALSTTYSGTDTDVNNFISRYANFANFRLSSDNVTATTGKGLNYKTIPLQFSDENTHLAIKAKYAMFTYVRCGYDIVVVTNVSSARANAGSLPPPKFQMLYCPPGCPVPNRQNSPEWYIPTTPTIIGQAGATPVSMRLPFVSVSSAYAVYYDGFSNFSADRSAYGTFPGNFLGTLAFRTLSDRQVVDGRPDFDVDFLCYARPTNVQAWIPRPIQTRKLAVSLSNKTSRLEPVVEEEEAKVLRFDESCPSGRISNCGGVPPLLFRSCPNKYKQIVRTMPLVWCGEGTFHGLAVSSNLLMLPYHLYKQNLYIQCEGEFKKFEHTLVKVDREHDFVLVYTATAYTCEVTPLCALCLPQNAVSACNTGTFKCWYRSGRVWEEADIFVDNLNNDFGPHTQRDLLKCNHPIPGGFCGSPLMCDHGVVGIATASNGVDSWFVDLRKLDFLHAMEQGPGTWIASIADQIGNSFGGGCVKAARDVIRDIHMQMNGCDPKMQLGKEIVNLLVKAICTCVLISKAEDKTTTAATLGVMLGVDLLLHSPFEWLECQVNKAIGVVARTARAQGPSDWIKEFNAACTAAKGLEWIGIQISKFVDWVKALFKKEDPRRRKFMTMLEDLPILMEHIDKIMVSRGKYSDEVVKQVCNSMRALKRGADVYGVERNLATTQILKYYNKAMGILSAMSKGRTEPVALLVHGQPGTGKSLCTEVIGRCLTKKLGGNRPYSLPPDPKHFDGYSQQPVVLMDDVGQNPDGEDLKLFCQMVSSTEFVVPQAALEEKGMAFTSDFVLASTNCTKLAPPTIAEPKALDRRFFLDMSIEVQRDYSLKGKLAADSALSQCSHPSVNFQHCCPLICGKALLLVDNRTGVRYSVDDVVSMLQREHLARKNCGSKLDALFQGPSNDEDDEWLESDYERAPHVLKTIDEQIADGIKNPAPKEIIDLMRAVPTPEVVQYCEQMGWIIPTDVEVTRTRDYVKIWIQRLATGLSILASVASLSGFVYLMYRVFANTQGVYSGEVKQVLKKPELRRIAVVQGPDMEFAQKLMNQSVFDVKTEKGHFSGLGLYDTWVLLPRHSLPGDEVELEGKPHKVLDIVELQSTMGSLEIVCVKLDRPTNFRDIRKYIPEHFSLERDCQLVINNENFRRMFCPVGAVTMFGFLNLSNNATYNTCSYRYPTRSGQCGGVVCKSGKIIAMHIGGDGVSGYGAILTRSMFAALQGQIMEMKKSEHKPINLSSKTKLHPSVFFDVFPGTKEPAALHPKDKRLEVDLETALFSKYKGNKWTTIDEDVLTAIDHYVEQIRPLMPANVTEPLSLEEVVYGTENLEGLDLATSAGFPYVTMGVKKKDLIPPRGEPLTRLQNALDLHGYDLPFVTYIKDELRPIQKVKAGKSRLIECSSLNDTIRMKMTFGRLFQVFHANPGTVTGSAVGCNPDFHWSKFYAEMGGNPLIAFDYSNYDASMEPMWFECIKIVLMKLGFTKEQVKIIDHINSSVHLYKDKQYWVEGGMPSGCSGTSIFNSINNNLIIRTLVLKTYKGINLDHLRIIAYGDDVVATYPFQLDAKILADAGKEFFNLTMTPPDKTADFNETDWKTVTFLKRRFVPDKMYPFLIHPVFPTQEVYDSIRWTRSAAATEEHVRSLCMLLWHTGEEEYNDFLQKVRSVPVGRAVNLPSFRALRQQWLDLF